MKFLKYINSTIALSIVVALTAAVYLSSCKEEDPDAGQIELFSFGPTGLHHGDIIQFIGQNLNKVTSIVLPGGVEVPSTQFASVSSKLIELVIPEGAEAGKVVLKTPQGDIQTKTIISFNVPVIITSISPEGKPGGTITIVGEFLNWIESIRFNDGIVVDEFVSQTVNELVVTVPMQAQTGFLLFASGGTEPLTFQSEEELIVTMPAVTSMSPMDIKHTENLTIAGTDLDLVTEILFTGDIAESYFVSKTATQLVVTIPVGVKSGPLTLKVASPLQVVTEPISIILPVGTGIAPKPAKPGIDNITITGTDLDLVGELGLPAVANPIPATSFISQSTTQIVLAVPEGAASGSITYKTIHGYSNNLGVTLIVPGEGPPPLAITMYDETMAPGGGDWSWNKDISDPASTEQFYSGNVSWKFVTPTDGGVSEGGMTAIDASGMGFFAFSVFGGPGTNGKSLACILNDNWGNYNAVTLTEGKWSEYKIPLSSYPGINPAAVTRWTFKVEGMAGSTIYVDRVGFEPPGPPALNVTIYEDAVGADWSKWGGWGGGSSDLDNTEQVRTGSKSAKVVFAGDWGGPLQFGGSSTTAGQTTFAFSIYGVAGTGGKELNLIVKNGGDQTEVHITIVEGEWTDYSLSLETELGNYPTLTEMFFQDRGWSGTLYIDHIGLR